jgi:hypothetical protein
MGKSRLPSVTRYRDFIEGQKGGMMNVHRGNLYPQRGSNAIGSIVSKAMSSATGKLLAPFVKKLAVNAAGSALGNQAKKAAKGLAAKGIDTVLGQVEKKTGKNVSRKKLKELICSQDGGVRPGGGVGTGSRAKAVVVTDRWGT